MADVAGSERDDNPDLIFPDTVIVVCHQEQRSLSRPVLVPQSAFDWAAAVTATRPAEATTADVRLLTALAGPESEWCSHVVNENDASPPVWGPSVGCLQTRTFLRDAELAHEPWRDRVWLEESITHQAESAWIIYRMQGHTAWGPRTDGKLPDDCSQSSVPDRCAEWWVIADAALS